MKAAGAAFGVVLMAGATIASAAVTESQFPPRTVRDLIEICAPAKEDPMMTAAINYCHGFAEGAVIKVHFRLIRSNHEVNTRAEVRII